MNTKRTTVLSFVILFGLYILFNAMMTLFRWFPEYEFSLLVIPSVESVVILSIIGLSLLLKKRARFVVLLVLAVLTSCYVAFGLGEAINQYAFQSHFVPWTDIGFISPLIDMIFGLQTTGKTVILILGIVIFFSALTVLLFFLFRLTVSKIHQSGFLTLILGCFFVPALLLSGEGPTLTRLMGAQVSPPSPVVISAEEELPPETVEEPAPQEVFYTFPPLKDQNVYLFIVESYGHTLFSREDHYELIHPSLTAAETRLEEAGYTIASTFLSSPITGGRSWLADATLLTGVWVDSQHKYDSLTGSDVTNLIHIFEEAEYNTIMSAPGTDEASDEWKAFYSFDEYYFADDFGYQGPAFCFGRMPDQYQLNWLRRGPLQRQTQDPRFLMSILVSSHTPFNYIPAYVEDWDSITDGSRYHERDNLWFQNNWLSGEEYPQGYTSSVNYVIRVLTDFFTRYISDDGLIIIAGDHQPRFPVREKEATTSVIVHVLSRNNELIRTFLDNGFEPGMQPGQPPPHRKLDIFAPLLLDIIQDSFPDVAGISEKPYNGIQ